MKNLGKFLALLLLLVLFTSSGYAQERWQWVQSTPTLGAYFDTQTITYDQGLIQVSVRYVYAEEREDDLQKIEENVHYDIHANTYSLGAKTYYDSDGEALKTLDYHFHAAKPVQPGTFNAAILGACKTYLGVQTQATAKPDKH